MNQMQISQTETPIDETSLLQTPQTAMTLEEASLFLNMPSGSVRYLARHKRIPAAKVGRTWRFLQHDLESFIRQQYGQSDKEDNNGNSNHLSV